MTNLKEMRESFVHTNVLYVEDEIEVNKMTVKFLEKIFTHVDSAVDGQEGLEFFIKNKYDLVITDLKMPRMGGREMLKKIKELDKDVVLFVMTASDSHVDISTTICDAYLNKPMVISDFIAALSPLEDRLKRDTNE